MNSNRWGYAYLMDIKYLFFIMPTWFTFTLTTVLRIHLENPFCLTVFMRLCMFLVGMGAAIYMNMTTEENRREGYAAKKIRDIESDRKMKARKEILKYKNEYLKIRRETKNKAMFINESELNLGMKLGEGHFGVAFEAMFREKKVVVKISKIEGEIHDMRSIVSMIGMRPHCNVLHLIGVSRIRDQFATISPFCSRGSLDKLHYVYDLAEPSRLKGIALDLFTGLAHLHENNIVHRDIACRNVFMDKEGRIVIGDWGLARRMQEHQTFMTSGNGMESLSETSISWPWSAPESLFMGHFSPKSDIWMAGVTLWEITTKGEAPYGWNRLTHLERQQIAAAVMEGTPHLLQPPPGKNIDPIITSVMDYCFEYKYSQRPSAGKMIQIIKKKKKKQSHSLSNSRMEEASEPRRTTEASTSFTRRSDVKLPNEVSIT
mmetsp:Transcript_27431/g.44137  ORF Transcript_27431/g.44137 Transcript_27431/m.44137 type:complete len:431 (-) Transcript_27431:1428-2720(-)